MSLERKKIWLSQQDPYIYLVKFVNVNDNKKNYNKDENSREKFQGCGDFRGRSSKLQIFLDIDLVIFMVRHKLSADFKIECGF